MVDHQARWVVSLGAIALAAGQFTEWPVGSPSSSVPQILRFGVPLAVAFGLLAFAHTKLPRRLVPSSLFVVALPLASASLCTLLSSRPDVARNQIIGPLTMTLLGVALASTLEVRELVVSWVGGLLIVATCSAMHGFLVEGWSFWSWQGVLPYKNLLGIYAGLLLISAMGCVLDRRLSRRHCFFTAGLVGLAVLLMIKARSATSVGAMVAIPIAVLLRAAFSRSSNTTTRTMTRVIIAYVVLVGWALVANGISLQDRFLSSLGKNDTFTGRSVIWERAHAAWLSHPWVGLGIHVFDHDGLLALMWNSPVPFEQRQLALTGAHSQYWAILTDAGIIGFGAFAIWTIALAAKFATEPFRGGGHMVPLTVLLYLLICGITETNVLVWTSPAFAFLSSYYLRLRCEQQEGATCASLRMALMRHTRYKAVTSPL